MLIKLNVIICVNILYSVLDLNNNFLLSFIKQIAFYLSFHSMRKLL